MKKIKLFVDGHWFDEPFQSTGVFLKGLYQVMANDDRFEIYMAAYNIPGLASEFEGYNIKYLKYSSHSKYKRLAFDVPKITNRFKFDYIHFQYVLPLFKTTREIVTIHDVLFMDFPNLFPWKYRMTKQFLFRQSARRAEIITTVSSFSKRAIVQYFKIPQDKIKIIPNGISSSFIQTQDIKSDLIRRKYNLEDYILYVSRIEPRKNHINLLKAFVNGNYSQLGYKLVLVGKMDIEVPELRQYLNSQTEEMKSKVIFLSGIDEATLKELYLNANLFVYPSLAEGFGIPPLEAAVLKTKTLCSNATAMADFDFFEEDLIPVNNVDTLINEINRKLLADDTQKREKIANQIKQKYKWEKIADDFAELIIAQRFS